MKPLKPSPTPEPQGLASYANAALPKLFSETHALVDAYDGKLQSGKFLDSGEIRAIEAILHEEMSDAGALQMFLAKNYTQLGRTEEDQIGELEAFSEKIDTYAEYVRQRIAEIIAETSVGMTFFGPTMSFLEAYEKTYGFLPMEEENCRELLSRISWDYSKATESFDCMEEMSLQAVQPMNEAIVELVERAMQKRKTSELPVSEEADTGFEIGGLVFRRALTAEDFRTASKAAQAQFNRDFDRVKRRFSSHGMKVAKILTVKKR